MYFSLYVSFVQQRTRLSSRTPSLTRVSRSPRRRSLCSSRSSTEAPRRLLDRNILLGYEGYSPSVYVYTELVVSLIFHSRHGAQCTYQAGPGRDAALISNISRIAWRRYRSVIMPYLQHRLFTSACSLFDAEFAVDRKST